VHAPAWDHDAARPSTFLLRAPSNNALTLKRNWSIAMEPHPTPDGHERLVRALRFVAKSAPCLTRTPTDMKRALGLDDPADDRMDRTAAADPAPAEEDGK